MDNLVALLREWHPVAQFFFMSVLTATAAFILFTVLMEIAKFFNRTLPIIFRGWPPEDNYTDDEKDHD